VGETLTVNFDYAKRFTNQFSAQAEDFTRDNWNQFTCFYVASRL